MKDAAELIKALASITWPVVVIGFLWFYRAQLRAVLEELVGRLRKGAKLKVWGLELETIAVAGERVRVTEVGPVAIRIDEELNRTIKIKQEESKYVFLVHYVYPLESPKRKYDVLLYVLGHFNDMGHVEKVEYFLGPGWDNAVFVCDDRTRFFAIKISAHGEFLAVARVHFADASYIETSRFIELDPSG